MLDIACSNIIIQIYMCDQFKTYLWYATIWYENSLHLTTSFILKTTCISTPDQEGVCVISNPAKLNVEIHTNVSFFLLNVRNEFNNIVSIFWMTWKAMSYTVFHAVSYSVFNSVWQRRRGGMCCNKQIVQTLFPYLLSSHRNYDLTEDY